MLSDYFGDKPGFKIFFLVLIPFLAIACIFKILVDKQPVNVDSSNTNIVNVKEDNKED